MNFKVALAILGMLALLAGCGKKEEQTVYSGDDGKVTVTRGDEGETATVVVDGEEGRATWSSGQAAGPEDLGISLYPGATPGQGGTLQVAAEDGGDADSVVSVSLHSTDSIDKITQYYRDELLKEQPRILEMAMPTGKMVTMTVEKGGAVKTVVLSENSRLGGTDIQISRIRE